MKINRSHDILTNAKGSLLWFTEHRKTNIERQKDSHIKSEIYIH